jgi:hypothetical protein
MFAQLPRFKISTQLLRPSLTPVFHPCYKTEDFDLHPQPRPETQPTGKVSRLPPFAPISSLFPYRFRLQELWYRPASPSPSIICHPVLLLAHSGSQQLCPPSCYIWRERLLAYRLPLPLSSCVSQTPSLLLPSRSRPEDGWRQLFVVTNHGHLCDRWHYKSTFSIDSASKHLHQVSCCPV